MALMTSICSGNKNSSDTAYNLTIITVCKNTGMELSHTVDSVIWHKKNGKLSIEHLIIDGASTDNTLNIIKDYAAHGLIESFISEPDSGIYHAMNKGINLARGKVLYFLNAGDKLLKTDLAAYVTPILDGTAVSSAAPVLTDITRPETQVENRLETCYIITPISHQGFFCAARIYKELGGYDQTYRCIADAKFMCSCIHSYGEPIKIDIPVAYYLIGGFSEDCGYTFLNEFIRMRSEFLPQIIQKAKNDEDYLYYAVGAIGESAFTLVHWLQEYQKEKEALIPMLQQQCRGLRKIAPGILRKATLFWLERVFLPLLLKGHPLTRNVKRIMRYAEAAILPPENNFQVRHFLIRPTYLKRLLQERLDFSFNKR